MERYLKVLNLSIFVRKACNQIEREKVYSIAREACQQFVIANAVSDVEHIEELFLLESSIDELENSITSNESIFPKTGEDYQLAA